MGPFTLRAIIVALCILTGIQTQAAQVAETPPGLRAAIRPADVDLFESQYESWVESIAAKLLPNHNFKIIAQFQYATDQGTSEDETHDVPDHLPGLPLVRVNDDSQAALKNPLYNKIISKKIRLVSEYALTQSETKILRDVLNHRLKLNIEAGDALAIDTPTSNAVVSTPVKFTQLFGLIIGIIACLGFGLAAVGTQDTPQNFVTEIQAHAPSSQATTAHPNLAPIQSPITVDPQYKMAKALLKPDSEEGSRAWSTLDSKTKEKLLLKLSQRLNKKQHLFNRTHLPAGDPSAVPEKKSSFRGNNSNETHA